MTCSRSLKEQLDAATESPYPASMLSLGKALAASSSGMVRKVLETYGTCRINTLAGNIVNSLEYDASAVFVLEKLALDRRLRDSILERSPPILDTLFKVACTNEKSFEKHKSAVLALLAHPLPSSLLLPTSIKPFLNLLTNAIARSQSEVNLRGLYTLLSAHPDTLATLTNQRIIHAALSKCLINPDQQIKFLTIGCLARIAQSMPSDDSQDHPQSLFEGTKGAKVVRLAITTALSEIANPGNESFELVKLCSVAISVVDSGLLMEWAEQKGSAQQLMKLRERGEGQMEEGRLLAARAPSSFAD